jgi:hypothetical protein
MIETVCGRALWSSEVFDFGGAAMWRWAREMFQGRKGEPAVSATPGKKFKLRADEIRALAPGRGACLATDRITVDGHEVGLMYRETLQNASDSGWRFFAGTETQEYLDQPDHTSIYDVNTIANYDPEIIPTWMRQSVLHSNARLRADLFRRPIYRAVKSKNRGCVVENPNFAASRPMLLCALDLFHNALVRPVGASHRGVFLRACGCWARCLFGRAAVRVDAQREYAMARIGGGCGPRAESLEPRARIAGRAHRVRLRAVRGVSNRAGKSAFEWTSVGGNPSGVDRAAMLRESLADVPNRRCHARGMAIAYRETHWFGRQGGGPRAFGVRHALGPASGGYL